MIRGAVVIFWKDVSLEFRGRELLLPALLFGLLVAMLYGLAFDPTANQLDAVFPGLLWLGLYFSSFLAIGRAFQTESEVGVQLLLAPVDRGALFLAKLLLNIMITAVLAAVLVPAFLVLLRAPLPGELGLFAATLGLGIVGFAAAGTAMAALAAQTRLRELLLPLLLLPLISPLVLGDVSATSAIFGGHAAKATGWLGLLAVFDLVYLIVPPLMFEFLTEV